MQKTIPQDAEQIRNTVKKAYGEHAACGSSCAAPADAAKAFSARAQSQRLGYKAEELDAVPEDANLGLGCGNPGAMASLSEGEVVVDLGAGAGLDAFLAAQRVGETGRVIGVDMTPEMLVRARRNAEEAGLSHRVEFREGIIEELPVESASADVVISNCVINLSPDKPRVFREAFRVLKSGGRLAVSDILLSEPLPEDIRTLATAYVACVGGASVADDYLAGLRDAGFVDIDYERVPAAGIFEGALADPIVSEAVKQVGLDRVRKVTETVFSYKIRAKKP